MKQDIPTAVAGLPPVPYRGIEPFRFVDQSIFFSREAEVERLVRNIVIYRGVLLYGDSGAGKSSLVNAGCIPRILEEGFIPDRLRVQPRSGEEIIVERTSLVEDGSPPYLPSNFCDDSDGLPRFVLSLDEFGSKLHALPAGRCALLIFDQFEELVTLFEDTSLEADAPGRNRVQAEILQTIIGLLKDHSLPVKLLFVFREDYLAKLSGLTSVVPELLQQLFRLTPLRVDSLHGVIRGSFERFPGHFRTELSPRLADDLATAIAARSEGGVLNLSEVQIVCLQLWQSADPRDLLWEKGVQGILEDYLSQAIEQLRADYQYPAVAILSRLLTTSGTRNVIAGDDLFSIIHSEESISIELLKGALDALEREAKVVRRELVRDTAYYEIVSEFLVPWIQHQKAQRAIKLRELKSQEVERRKMRRLLKAGGVVSLIGLSVMAFLIAYVNDEVAQTRAEKERVGNEIYKDSVTRNFITSAVDSTAMANSTQHDLDIRMMKREDSLSRSRLNRMIAELNSQVAYLRNDSTIRVRRMEKAEKEFLDLRLQWDSHTSNLRNEYQSKINRIENERRRDRDVIAAIQRYIDEVEASARRKENATPQSVIRSIQGYIDNVP